MPVEYVLLVPGEVHRELYTRVSVGLMSCRYGMQLGSVEPGIGYRSASVMWSQQWWWSRLQRRRRCSTGQWRSGCSSARVCQ